MPSATSPLVEDHQLAVDTIRTLSIDGVQQANSGHPGAPMGAAAMAYVLWTRFLHHCPTRPDWPDRDRFVLSAGHGARRTGHRCPRRRPCPAGRFGGQCCSVVHEARRSGRADLQRRA